MGDPTPNEETPTTPAPETPAPASTAPTTPAAPAAEEPAADPAAAPQYSEQFTNWYKSAMEKGSEAVKGSAQYLKDNYARVKDYMDFDENGKLTFNDAKEGFSALGEQTKKAFNTASEYVMGDDQQKGLWGKFTENPSNFLMAGMGALLFGLLFGGESVIGMVIAALIGAAVMGGISMMMQKDDHHETQQGPNQQIERGRGQELVVEQEIGKSLAQKKDGENIQEASNVLTKEEYSEILRKSELIKSLNDRTYEISPEADLGVQTMQDGQVLLTPEAKGLDLGPVILATQDPKDKTLTGIQVQMKQDGKDVFVTLDDPAGGKYTASQGTEILAAAREKAKQDNGTTVADGVSVDEISAPLMNAAMAAKPKEQTTGAAK